MVSLKIQLLATILFISEGYGQGCACGYNQRYGPTPAPQCGQVIPACQFCVPAVIKPLICPCQSSSVSQSTSYPCRTQSPIASCAPASRVDCDDDPDLDKLLYLLISNMMDSRKCSGRKCGCNSNYNYDGNLDCYDCYDSRSSSYDCRPSCYYSRPSGYDSRPSCYESRPSGYDCRSPNYCDDYDYTQPCTYSPPCAPYCSSSTCEPYTVTTSCENNNNCPEIVVKFTPCASQCCQTPATDC